MHGDVNVLVWKISGYPQWIEAPEECGNFTRALFGEIAH